MRRNYMTEYIFFLTQRIFPLHSVFAIDSVIFRQRLFCIFFFFFFFFLD